MNELLPGPDWSFEISEDRYAIKNPAGQLLRIDFDNNHIDYLRKRHRGFQEIIAKALGLSKAKNRVLDLSAGLGMDAVFLSQLGANVTAIERNPAVHFLLSQALEKSSRRDLTNLRFICEDSKKFLEVNKQLYENFDSIYFDPMYPDKKKSALPRKEMVIFRSLVGDDLDSSEVFDRALEINPGRLVVKRPVHAEFMNNKKPIHSFLGKTVRFDLYSR